MTDPWSNSSDEDDEDEDNQSASQLSTAIDTNALDNLPIENVEEGVNSVDDVDLLKRAYEKTDSSEVEDLVQDRLHDLDAVPPNGETEQSSLEDSTMSDDTEDTAEESSIDVSSIAPNAMSSEEAKNKEHTWRVMSWGDPGVGKTHFAYTMPGPVCLIDTEGKADHIAHKFDKEFFIWQPEDYDGAKEALNEALDVLDQYRAEADEIGTLAVDSMSIMWEWAQQKYVDKFYPDTSYEEAKENFTAGFGGGQSDWKKIKDFHNAKFREIMLNSPYHILWTAMAEDDYEAAMDGVQGREKPVGEKNNVYKVDHIIHIDQNEEGVPTGSLEKSGLTKYRFTGLEHPDFEKMSNVVDSIEDAEQSDEDVDVNELTDYDISVMQGNPRFINNE